MVKARTAVSRSSSVRGIAHELAEGAGQDDAAVALVFAAPTFDGDELAAALQETFGSTPVIGCTTSGEISRDGFSTDSVVAMTLASSGLRIGVGLASDITRGALSGGRAAAAAAMAELGLDAGALNRQRHVAITLIDGRTQREESVIAGVASTVPSIGVVGGSASDTIGAAPRARIFAQGRAHADSALVLLLETDAPFRVLMSEHLIPTEKRVVVTASDPETRTVLELSGKPARIAIEELLGTTVDTDTMARTPFAQFIGGQAYIRSVLEVEGSALRFACAVENGVILRLVEPGDLIGTTRDALDEAAEALGGIDALIGFHCYGRFLEAESRGITRELGEVLGRHPIVGFNTFGEQMGALHVNHTFTALALGRQTRG